ncbi:hypothetical protein G7Z17_g1484 [Cylindrodendrum hubeiense]|uniref:Uncharacterized protein n=1 Tax=Cylindrodendrum hubeiense TaxID=595255 RepID=A0A9P5HJF5_9HYPO|nr:hypothetical protein G7Z17_g1484 [Cylindrodendrum hubeiense]
MAGAVDSPSRLGLTLQGFHQVIALSQANVNESLEYHFANNKKLCNFDVLFANKGYGLKGKMSSPTIALIDIEAADQAIFSLNFESGKYFWVEFPELDPGAEPLFDEDGLLILPTPKKESLSVAGWSLAFLVHFSVEKMATVPSGIRSMVELPGSYSVEQLMIDFGTADLIKFSWKHCVIPGVPEEKLATGRADIERFVGAYLNDVLLKPGNHNILGYAVKIDPPSHGQTGQDQLQKVAPVGRYFPPTSVRLQTINHRPDGNATSSSASNDHNAMLFTEMTQFHTMLTKDLQWSGNWFYDGIGGTMAISRGIFVDQYLAEELRVVGVQNWNLANVVSRKLSDNPQHGDWVLKMGQPDMGNIVLTAGHGLEIHHKSFDTNSVKWTSPAKWLVGERLVPTSIGQPH